MTKLSYRSLERWQEWQAQRLETQQQVVNPKHRKKVSVEIPLDTWKLTQNLAGRLRLPAGGLVERAVKSAIKMAPGVIAKRVRGQKLEKILTSFKVSQEAREMWRVAGERAREEDIFLWQFIDAALRQYRLGRLRPAKKRGKKKALERARRGDRRDI